MFVYSVRASTLKIFCVIALVILAIVALIVFLPHSQSSVAKPGETDSKTVCFDNIKTNEDRIGFLGKFGWETEAEPAEEESVTIPESFDKVFSDYNAIQKEQGLDLQKYRKKDMTRYTYIVTNYPDYDGIVYANLLIYKNRVVGGDICSARADGFVHGFEK